MRTALLLVILAVACAVQAAAPGLKVDRKHFASGLRGNADKYQHGAASNRVEQTLEKLEGVRRESPSAGAAEGERAMGLPPIVSQPQQEAGCDGVAGSGLDYDQCGECGGSDDCLDCAGTPFGSADYDMCGVCGGTDECIDECGVPFGDSSTCCHCFLGFCDEGWDQLLLVETIDDLVRKFKALRLVLDEQCEELNKIETVGCFDVPADFDLPIGSYAECNFSYLLNCLSGFPDLLQLIACDHSPCDLGCPNRPEECMVNISSDC